MKVQASSLTTVLKVKQFQEKATQKELAEKKITRETEEEKLGRLEQSKETALDQTKVSGRTRAADLQTSLAFVQSLTRQISQQGEKVDAAKESEDQKRGELVERSRSRQMVEKLDARRKVEQEKEAEKKAQRVMDVLAQRMKVGM
jgi:flagellar export protein FliJ